ncbi:MAG: TlpA family protein disulfide reductase [Armatimonadota bacterium]
MRELAVAMAVVIGLMACGVALGQEEEATLDIVNAGKAMREAADQGEWADAYSRARQIVQATGDTLKNRSAEELYWIAMSHMYLMAQVFEMAEQAGLPAERAKFATDVVDWVKGAKTEEEVRVISHGEQVNLEDYLVEGQTVIFDFTSKYCGPCVRLGPYLEQLAQERDDIVLVKVDINRPGQQGIDWQSPVARQFNLQSIPAFKVYGPEGDLVAEGDRARQMVMQWIQQLQG